MNAYLSTILTSERELILSTYIVIPTSTAGPENIDIVEDEEDCCFLAVREMRPWCVQCRRHSPGTYTLAPLAGY